MIMMPLYAIHDIQRDSKSETSFFTADSDGSAVSDGAEERLELEAEGLFLVSSEPYVLDEVAESR